MDKITNPCSVCLKSVRSNQKVIFYGCLKWIHLKCTIFSTNDYCSISEDNGNWICQKCLSEIFSFYVIDNDFDFLCCLYNNTNSNKINAYLIKKTCNS